MNNKRLFIFLLVFSLSAVFTTSNRSAALTTLTTPDGPTAFGEGTFAFHGENHFSFTATVNNHGKGKGRAVFENLLTQTRVEVRLDCVQIDSTVAIMSGTVQHSDDPNLPKHDYVIFSAGDETHAPFFVGDSITPLFSTLGSDFDCSNSGGPLTILPLSSGNIVVQP